MRNLFIIPLLLPAALFAQNLWPTSEAAWRVEKSEAAGVLVPDEDPNMLNVVNGILTTQIYYELGDVYLNEGLEYIELLQNYEAVFESFEDNVVVNYPLLDDAELRGVFRIEDSRVYFKEAFSSSEFLLYEFDLDVGDTLPLSFINNFSVPIVVAEIDTLYFDGVPHRRYSLEGSSVFYDELIEGVGNINGPIQHLGLGIDISHTLVCFSLDGNSQFPDSSAECSSNTVMSVDELYPKENSIAVYPNPSRGKVTIQINSNQLITQFILFDTVGKELKRRMVSDDYIELEREQLPQGIYYLQLLFSDGKVKNERVMYID
jgi:hypothetical protein